MVSLFTFQNDGLSFDVDDSGGEGDGVILLHGFPQTKESWHAVTPALSEAGYRVIAPDQRGYSPAARPPRRRDYSIDKLVGDVLALADTAQLERFHVIGHDWGGAVAWGLAAAHPDRLASVASLSTPHPRAMASSMIRSTQALKSWYMAAFQLPLVPEKFVGLDGGKRVKAQLVKSGLPEEQAAASVELLTSGGARSTIAWYRAIPFSPPALGDPSTVPTLYVYGDDDFALGRKAADLTGDHVTGPYRYEVLPGVGHWIPEHPEVLNPILLDHLASHPA